jgi:hypothetical protein
MQTRHAGSDIDGRAGLDRQASEVIYRNELRQMLTKGARAMDAISIDGSEGDLGSQGQSDPGFQAKPQPCELRSV